jgi:hypothetical protein
MSSLISESLALVPEHDLAFVAGTNVVRHSHHYNLTFDQTIDDALGVERGVAIRTRAAHEASYRLLRAMVAKLPASRPQERLELADEIFAAMGQGRLELDVSPQGGWVNATALHYGIGWKRKYGRKLPRRYPSDAVAAGFIAAAVEVAYDLHPGELSCHQTSCLAMGAGRAEFMVRRIGGRFDAAGLTMHQAAQVVPPPLSGIHEDRIRALTDAVREILGDLDADERGLCEEFGVLSTAHLGDYYNHLSMRMLDISLTEKPQCLDVARRLLSEAGCVGAFHLFGGILASPVWPSLAGSAPRQPDDVVVGGLAIARALGFGRWALEAHVPGESLVLRSAGTYESVFSRAMSSDGESACCYQLEGAAHALMQLSHRVSWDPPPAIGDELYLALQRERSWRCRQTHCVAGGDAMDRVVLMRA